MLVPSVDRQQLEGLARRIFEDGCRPVRWGDVDISVGTSIGLATAPACGDSVQQLLQAADLAMYEAKRGARETTPIRAATRPPSTSPPSRVSLHLAR